MTLNHLPVLIIVVPFITALVIAALSWFSSRWAWLLTVASLTVSTVSSALGMRQVLATGKLTYALGGWMPPIGISYVVDHLNGMMLCVISVIGLLVTIFSYEFVKKEVPQKIGVYYSLFLLSIVGLLGMTITGDAFNLYVLLEVSSLTIYALIAVGGGRALFASFNYMILGTVGACFYLLGVGYLYLQTGSLTMADIHHILPDLMLSTPVAIGFFLILFGLLIKAGFFPLHGWLPNAYAYAPTSTFCFAAPLMTKVALYIMIRILFTVFGPDYSFTLIPGSLNLVWLAVIAIVAGSAFALMQTDVKKMIAYIIVAEVGYIVGGVWLANRFGLTGAIYHVFADSVMTLCLCLATAAITYKLGSSKLEDWKGVFHKMPFAMTIFLIGAAGVVGVPPTCGFFSKWYLIMGGLYSGYPSFIIALLISSLCHAVLFFRIIEIGYFHTRTTAKRLHLPFSMTIPMAISGLMVIGVGLLTHPIVSHVITPFVPVAWLGGSL